MMIDGAEVDRVAARRHPAVQEAAAARVYVDRQGTTWKRGMDGWFGDDMPGVIHLLRHDDMAAIIVREHDGALVSPEQE